MDGPQLLLYNQRQRASLASLRWFAYPVLPRLALPSLLSPHHTTPHHTTPTTTHIHIGEALIIYEMTKGGKRRWRHMCGWAGLGCVVPCSALPCRALPCHK
mmetsp:Transcript_11388/g.18574  ORF Transcript_11388/g.18574 Transcript_11388/m.18574 type:complete len:101 (-) Transcript_11388:461-763(-)